MTNSSLENDVYVPAPLNLPFGKLFFGFNVQTYVPPQESSSSAPQQVCPTLISISHFAYLHFKQSGSFSGSGATLSGGSTQASLSAKGKGKEQPSPASWGSGGQRLGSRPSQPATSSQPRALGAGGASVPVLRNRQQERERSPTPDFGVDEDEDIDIDYDSD